MVNFHCEQRLQALKNSFTPIGEKKQLRNHEKCLICCFFNFGLSPQVLRYRKVKQWETLYFCIWRKTANQLLNISMYNWR